MFALLIGAALAASPTSADRAAIFTAAGFRRVGQVWRSDCDDPGTSSYTPGAIELYRDLNGDGRPEAVVTEGGTFCYGNTGQAFTLLTKSPKGRWVKISRNIGIPTFLKTRANGWPELEVGGPGFCFGVHRFNGRAYDYHRSQYDGKPCRR